MALYKKYCQLAAPAHHAVSLVCCKQGSKIVTLHHLDY